MKIKFNQLEFRRSFLPKDKDLKEDRPFVDFIIDEISLSKHLGKIEDPITPYGWGNNKKSELAYAERLINFKKSDFDNGLQSAYVCACCGDEECGAVMFEVVNHGRFVEWLNFMYSEGYPTEDEPDEKIEITSLYFEIGSYQKAIGQLKSMIK
ncbi:MAG: hypothetical protein COA58_11490 [Bacteroidetes bacterium]|nr:MAG: hypothetical protein COA58_11490 [Bacteroidota bacterium]